MHEALSRQRTFSIPILVDLLTRCEQGTNDEIFPIDDYYLALEHGDPKEARFMKGIKHMGEPESFLVIVKWIYRLLGITADPVEQLKTIPFQPKF